VYSGSVSSHRKYDADGPLVLNLHTADRARRRALTDLFGVVQDLGPDDVSRLMHFAAALKQRSPDEMVVFTDGPQSGRAGDFVLRLDADTSTCWRGRPNVVSIQESVVVHDRLNEPLLVEHRVGSDDSARVIVLGTGGARNTGLILDYTRGQTDAPAAHETVLETRNADRARALRDEVLRESVPVGQAARLLGRTEQTAINRAKAGEMLAFRDGNRWMFPSWQFDGAQDNGIVSGIRETIKALEVAPYLAVTWFRKANRVLENRRPIDVLRAGEIERVVTAAKSVGQQ
jgi:hypothetical protein